MFNKIYNELHLFVFLLQFQHVMGFRSGNYAMKSCVLIGGKWRHMIEDWLEEAASNFMSPVA